MPDTPKDTTELHADTPAEERLPWYKRTAVIVALIGALVALTGTAAKLLLPRLMGTSSKVVRGKVSDLQMHPIGGAKVSLQGKGLPPLIYTDSEGVFTFNLPDDVKEIKVRVEAGGYSAYERLIEVSATSELEEIRLTPETETNAQLWGYVRDRDERPLQGVKVWLEDFPNMPPVETATNGGFWIKDIPRKYGEMVRLRAIKDGYQPDPCIKDALLGGQGSIVIYLTAYPRPSRLPC